MNSGVCEGFHRVEVCVGCLCLWAPEGGKRSANISRYLVSALGLVGPLAALSGYLYIFYGLKPVLLLLSISLDAERVEDGRVYVKPLDSYRWL